MGKQDVIVDTCFLQKITSDGSLPDNAKRVLDELDFNPVVNKYVAEQEYSLWRYMDEMVKKRYIRVVEYDEYIKDEADRIIYEDYFKMLYNEMKGYLEAKGGPKQIPPLNIPKDKSIFTAHSSGSSMGDVHMILMAAYMRLPIILTEDSDIELLRDMAKRRLSMSTYQLEIFDAVDLLIKIAKKEDSSLSRKELKQIIRQMGEKDRWRKEMKILDEPE